MLFKANHSSLLAFTSVFLAIGFLKPAIAQNATGNFVSSNAGATPFLGVNINDRVGANTLYNQGYTGTRSIIANVEAGLPWNGHETLTHQTTRFFSSAFGGTQLGETDRHATWVAQVLGGRMASGQEYQRGMAFGSTLWAGAIATSWSGAPFTLNFTWANNNAFLFPYQTAMVTGVNGQTADVINSSWGFGDSAASTVQSRAIDGLIWQSHKVMTASAGNSGPTANTVGGPATAYNVISVGATGSDTSAPSYNSVSSFSSRSPSHYFGPDGTFLNSRAKVDIIAPGQNLTLAFYGGATGGNKGGSVTGGPNFYSSNVAGTSFAAPTVGGGAALLVDVGKDRFGGGNSVDTMVIKSVLQTSADKLAGWTNALSVEGDGSFLTTQALDFAQGAGQMNLSNAFTVYTDGTTDLSGDEGGNVEEVGWDMGTVSASDSNEYFISNQLVGGTLFTATLNWLVHREFQSINVSGVMTAPDLAFSDLSLDVYSVIGGNIGTLVARSDAKFINNEHLSFVLPETGFYALQVNYLGKRYNLSGDLAREQYALSWFGTAAPVPEPTTMMGLAGILIVFARKRRK